MKRGYSDSPSTSTCDGPPKSRVKCTLEGDAHFSEDFVQKVADHYSAMTNQTLEEREASPIIHLKKLNNWIEDCRSRYNGDADHHQRCRKFSFPARLICADCYEVSLDEVLADDAPFDICSCQFALHCSWSTEALARRALANVSALLPPGGIFIGTMPDANVIVKKLREGWGYFYNLNG